MEEPNEEEGYWTFGEYAANTLDYMTSSTTQLKEAERIERKALHERDEILERARNLYQDYIDEKSARVDTCFQKEWDILMTNLAEIDNNLDAELRKLEDLYEDGINDVADGKIVGYSDKIKSALDEVQKYVDDLRDDRTYKLPKAWINENDPKEIRDSSLCIDEYNNGVGREERCYDTIEKLSKMNEQELQNNKTLLHSVAGCKLQGNKIHPETAKFVALAKKSQSKQMITIVLGFAGFILLGAILSGTKAQ
tara:strand:+ start:2344 stop:3099 length:756 start_codon:yes stop_codon:yes gene_type:complete